MSGCLGELLESPKKDQIAPNITQYNTTRPEEAMRAIREAARNNDRIEINGWDSDTNLMIPFMANPGHGEGVSARYFLEEMERHKSNEHARGTMALYLSKELINSSDIIGRGHSDFFQVNVYHHRWQFERGR